MMSITRDYEYDGRNGHNERRDSYCLNDDRRRSIQTAWCFACKANCIPTYFELILSKQRAIAQYVKGCSKLEDLKNWLAIQTEAKKDKMESPKMEICLLPGLNERPCHDLARLLIQVTRDYHCAKQADGSGCRCGHLSIVRRPMGHRLGCLVRDFWALKIHCH
jgi:hypothetical protein